MSVWGFDIETKSFFLISEGESSTIAQWRFVVVQSVIFSFTPVDIGTASSWNACISALTSDGIDTFERIEKKLDEGGECRNTSMQPLYCRKNTNCKSSELVAGGAMYSRAEMLQGSKHMTSGLS